MKTTDVIDLMKSKAMREHLKNINYIPTVREACLMLNSCTKFTSIEEQAELFQSLLDDNEYNAEDAFCINGYINKEKEKLDRFLSEEPDRKYFYKIERIIDKEHLNNLNQYFLDFNSVKIRLNTIAHFEGFADEEFSAIVRKYYIDDETVSHAHVRCKGFTFKIIGIHSYYYNAYRKAPAREFTDDEKRIGEYFNFIDFNLPTPFKKGDIIYDIGTAYVVDKINDNKPPQLYYLYNYELNSCDCIDLSYTADYVDDSTDIDSRDRMMLKCISDFVLGKIPVDWLIHTYGYYKRDEYYDWDYNDFNDELEEASWGRN